MLAVAVLGACAMDGGPTLEVTASDLGSPAGEDSGEPFLSVGEDGVYLSWLEASGEGEHTLRFASWDGQGWSAVRDVATSSRFFVNWADFPSLTPGPDGTLFAHWLQRGSAGGYDYGVRVARSSDGGATWSDPITPHDDDSPTEHGFVSTFPEGDGLGFVWLDGRKYVDAPDGTPASREMTLRYRSLTADGTAGRETQIDGRVCDCCQTDAALASSGPVVVYRDRSAEEIRDIYLSRLEGGVWTKGVPVHEDGWHITGCPVNGPAVAARADEVVVAWFTAAGDEPRVKLARSSDGGRTFGPPTRIDDGSPLGRVDVLMRADGSALVSWLEITPEGDSGQSAGAEVRLRLVDASGVVSTSAAVTRSSQERASGFPRMIEAADGSVVAAWTDVLGEKPQVRVQRIELGG